MHGLYFFFSAEIRKATREPQWRTIGANTENENCVQIIEVPQYHVKEIGLYTVENPKPFEVFELWL